MNMEGTNEERIDALERRLDLMDTYLNNEADRQFTITHGTLHRIRELVEIIRVLKDRVEANE